MFSQVPKPRKITNPAREGSDEPASSSSPSSSSSSPSDRPRPIIQPDLTSNFDRN
jgi:hypothetical protein